MRSARREAVRGRIACATASRSTRCATGTPTTSTSQARLPLLTTHMGHVTPASTYCYLTAAPDLLALAARRLEPTSERTPDDRLAPTLEAYFTDRLIRQRRVSPHTIASYRDTFRLLLAYINRTTGDAAIAAGDHRPRRGDDRRVLQHLETGAREHRPHPEHPARRDPLLLSLLRAAPPRARRPDPTRARDPAQTRRETHRHVPHPCRDASAARRPEPINMGRPARPRAAAHRRPDRAADLRAARPHARRHAARHRRARPDGRQRQKGASRAADQADRRGAPRLAPRDHRPGGKSAVSLARRRARSPATRSSGASPNTSRPRGTPACHCDPSGSRCTRCVTPPR